MHADGALVEGKTMLLSGWTFIPCQMNTLTRSKPWLSDDVTVSLMPCGLRNILQHAVVCSSGLCQGATAMCCLGQCPVKSMAELSLEVISRCPLPQGTTTTYKTC